MRQRPPPEWGGTAATPTKKHTWEKYEYIENIYVDEIHHTSSDFKHDHNKHGKEPASGIVDWSSSHDWGGGGGGGAHLAATICIISAGWGTKQIKVIRFCINCYDEIMYGRLFLVDMFFLLFPMKMKKYIRILTCLFYYIPFLTAK